jgi:hypothetical protein
MISLTLHVSPPAICRTEGAEAVGPSRLLELSEPFNAIV